MLSCFRRWSRTFSRRATAAPKPRSRPRLLALEDRVVPTNIGGAAYVAVGDVNGDGFDDVITGAGAGGSPHVRVFGGGGIGGVSPTDPTSEADVILNFNAGFAANFTGGVRVGAGDLGGDRTTAEVVCT